MKAISYYRFSTREQSEGTSIKRQSEDCMVFAASRGWTIEDTIIDEGKSAFSGANRDEGAALNLLEHEVRSGLHHGKVLLVERLDRISRQGFDETLDFVRLLTGHGVSVATVDGEFYEAGKRLDMFQVMKMLSKAEGAHEESAKKSQRIKRRYEIRRAEAKASGIALTKNLPAWLTVGKDGKPTIREGRDAVIRRIYDLAETHGKGSVRIMRALNAELQPWSGLNGATTAQWNRSFVTRILQDRQVTGEFQPCVKENGERVPSGEPWPDYFPRIISQEQFDRVNSAAQARQSPAGKKSTVVGNLFSGMLRCFHCDTPMLFERKKPAGSPYQGGRYTLKHDEARLRCRNAYSGGSCTNHTTLSYYGFERAMLDACLHLALDDRTFTRADELGQIMGKVAEKRRALDIATDHAKALWAAYAETKSKMAMQSAMDAEREAEVMEGELQSLEASARAASGQADAEAHLSRVAEFRRYLSDGDLEVREQHRTKVAQGFRTIVQSVRFDDSKTAYVNLIDGLRAITIRQGKVISNLNFDHLKRDPAMGKPPREAALIRAYLKRNRG